MPAGCSFICEFAGSRDKEIVVNFPKRLPAMFLQPMQTTNQLTVIAFNLHNLFLTIFAMVYCSADQDIAVQDGRKMRKMCGQQC